MGAAITLWLDDGGELPVYLENGDLLYEAGGGQDLLFDTLRVNVFSIRKDDHLVLAASHNEVAFFVELTCVPGMEPAVAQDFGCRFRFIVISLHDVFAAHNDLAVIDSDFSSLHREAGCSQTRLVLRIERNDGGRFGQSVALNHAEAKRPHFLEHDRIGLGTTRDPDTNIGTQRAVNFPKDPSAKALVPDQA